MLTRIVVTLAMAAMPATALGQAEVIVELVPQHPGPYKGGESFLVDVWLSKTRPFDSTVRTIQFDFSQSDPALALDPTFTFDFSSVTGLYNTVPELPVPWAHQPLDCVCPELFLTIPGEGDAALHIGSIGVQLPVDIGVYRLDVMNADEPDPSQGATLQVGVTWRAFTGEIAGGRFNFFVGLEGIPALSEWGIMALTLLLLGAGTVVIRRRRTVAGAGLR